MTAGELFTKRYLAENDIAPELDVSGEAFKQDRQYAALAKTRFLKKNPHVRSVEAVRIDPCGGYSWTAYATITLDTGEQAHVLIADGEQAPRCKPRPDGKIGIEA